MYMRFLLVSTFIPNAPIHLYIILGRQTGDTEEKNEPLRETKKKKERNDASSVGIRVHESERNADEGS